MHSVAQFIGNDTVQAIIATLFLVVAFTALLFLQGSFLIKALAALQRGLPNIHGVYIDGALYVMVAGMGAVLGVLNSDDIYKYCNPYIVFYGKALAEIILQMANALKMFRSSSYSDYMSKKNGTGQIANGVTGSEPKTEPKQTP